MAPPKRKRRRRTWFIITGIIVLILILAFLGKGTQTPEVTIAKIENRTLQASISEAGELKPRMEVRIAADVSGEIIEVFFKEGDRVEKGDLIMTIRPDDYQSALEQAQAAYKAAQAQYFQAQANEDQAHATLLQDSANYIRNQKLYQDKVISTADFEAIKLKYKISQTQLKSAKQNVLASFYQMESSKASLKQSRQSLSRTKVLATMDGILTKIYKEKGERVLGTIQMQGTDLITIADLSAFLISADINENDIDDISLEDSVEITIDAFPNQKFHGMVEEVAYSPNSAALTSSDQITSYAIKIALDSAQLSTFPKRNKMRSGMSAQVEIFTEKVENVVAVPIGAVTVREIESQDGSKTRQNIVFVLEKGNKVRQQPISLGIGDNAFYEVKNGLKSGEEIVSGPYELLTKELKNGDIVQVKTTQ